MTTIHTGNTTTTGFVVTADNSGDLVIKTGGAGGTAAATFDGNTGQATFSAPVSQPGAFMFRNKIINGNFDIWQRGTSQTTSGYGSVDRWRQDHAGSTKTASRQAFALGQTDVPNNPKYFMRHVVTSVAGAGNYVVMLQAIEGVETLAGQTATVSFWAKADATKNIAIEFEQGFGTGGSPSAAVNSIDSQLVALTTSWTKYTITVNIPSVSGKTLGTAGNDQLRYLFWFDAGSSFDARSASLGQQSGTFDIAQVQVEEGAAATPFEQRPIGLELTLCHRYFYRLNNGVNNFMRFATGAVRLSTEINGIIPLPTTMRGTRTATVSSASHFAVSEVNTNRTVTGFYVSETPVNSNWVFYTAIVASGLTPGRSAQFISNNTTASYIDFSAEL